MLAATFAPLLLRPSNVTDTPPLQAMSGDSGSSPPPGKGRGRAQARLFPLI